MKYMAVLISNKVVNVITASDHEFDTADRITYTPENRAVIGGDYVDGFFYRPQPFPSWTRDKGVWVAPVPMPQDGENYGWDEDAQEWHPVTV